MPVGRLNEITNFWVEKRRKRWIFLIRTLAVSEKLEQFKIWNQGGEFPSINYELVTKIVIAVLSVACIIGVAGNSIILIVLQCCKTKNPINILLINLAIANILFQIIVLPCQVAVYWFPYWTLGKIICRLSFITEDIASSQVSSYIDSRDGFRALNIARNQIAKRNFLR